MTGFGGSRSRSPRRRGPPAAPVTSRSSISTARASSNRSITAWLSLRAQSTAPAARSAAAGPMPSARSRSVVGQKQTVARFRPYSVDVGVAEMRAVDRGEVAGQGPGVVRGPRWASSRSGARQASFSAGCSETCACSGAAAAHSATSSMSRAATARTECTAAPTGAPGPRDRIRATRPSQPGRRHRRRTAAEARVPVPAEAAEEVAGVQHRDPDPGLPGGLREPRAPSRSGRRRTPPGAWCR